MTDTYTLRCHETGADIDLDEGEVWTLLNALQNAAEDLERTAEEWQLVHGEDADYRMFLESAESYDKLYGAIQEVVES